MPGCKRNGQMRIIAVNLVDGKHGRVRTVPMPTWVNVALDAWTTPAAVVEGHVFRSVNRSGLANYFPAQNSVFLARANTDARC